ncbi:MAG: hypothetical protein LBJ73_00500 [Rickettsiales bacterium]|jgi:hypothetical protein|nr:hypothetical protein [Rickettsiales bacterium]
MKPRYKRRIFWTAVSAVAAGALALVIVPPFVRLNNLKPRIESAIFEQTGLAAKIDGDVSFSLAGGATIVARDVAVERGRARRVMFSVPVSTMFDLNSVELTGDIFVYDARFAVGELTPPKFAKRIDFRNSIVSFKGKDYEIIRGALADGLLRGVVRTDQHKYEFDSDGDQFHITGKSNDLDIRGRLFSDGSARGALSIDTENVNEWFEFKEPRVTGRVKLAMDFDWNGNYGFKFSNIRGDNFSGQIELFDDGHRDIALRASGADFDLSFLLGTTGIFRNTAFDLDLYGNLKFADRHFKHVAIDAAGTASEIVIRNIVADDIIVSGGVITANGAENMPVRMQIGGRPVYCLFSGSPDSWKCSDFTYGDLRGSLSVSNGEFDVFIRSDARMPDNTDFVKDAEWLGGKGRIDFQFLNIGGTISVGDGDAVTAYRFAKDKTLGWLGADFGFMPGAMRAAVGDFVWDDNGLSFAPHSKRWKLSVAGDFFYISGANFKDWMPDANLRALNDSEYIVSGNYRRGNISNLEIKVAGHVFRGAAIGRDITLTTDLLNIDALSSQDFIDDYDELRFLNPDPLTIPYTLGVNVSLSAKSIIFNGDRFANFVYSLRDGTQGFSITDAARGSILAGIARAQNKYAITLQMNRFAASGRLLSAMMPVNIADTMITGRAVFDTYGQIAYDFWHNLAGSVDMAFDGGRILGLGIDDFYAGARDITKMNAEFVLAGALDGGDSALKSLHIIGDYAQGGFATTRPFELSMRHADATGDIVVNGGAMSIRMNLVLRGTSPLPAPIAMEILPNGRRDYSLSQIMTNFDPDFFRDFVATHNKF